MRPFLLTIEVETLAKKLETKLCFALVEIHNWRAGLSFSLYYRIVSTMQFFRNNATVPLFLTRVKTSRSVLPTAIFPCQNYEIWRCLEVVGINIFGLAYLSNLAYFSTTGSLTYAKCWTLAKMVILAIFVEVSAVSFGKNLAIFRLLVVFTRTLVSEDV